MKRSTWVIVIIVLLLAGFAVFLWWEISSSINRATNPSAPTTSNSVKLPAQPIATPPSPLVGKQLPGGPYEPTDPRWQWWNEQRRKDRKFEWKMAINFYGRVVDETGVPVPNATVKFQWNDTSSQGTSYSDAVSDAGGNFSLNCATGKMLEVRVSKKGYRSAESNNDGFEYAAFFEKNYYTPDAANPVIFQLRKKARAEPLLTRQTLYGFKIDGSPAYIDLMTGRKSFDASNADVAISVERPVKAAKPFDWSLKIQGMGDTTVIESQDGLAFEAPRDGYQKELKYTMGATDTEWRSSVNKRIFVRGRNGQLYALLQADVMPLYNDKAAIDLTVYVNPNGSRNLEPER